ncbi:MAG: dephospho-CoA kinase [Coriobacteriaceae bacterium]|nr:dephospho-CoA kinase [Coriobacteriaceae bacterium]
MFVILVTGGLGAGKSTAAKYFGSRGAVVLDLDEIGHRLLRPGSPAHPALIAEFGEGVLASDGTIDRPALAKAAFASPERAARLNSIMHPAVFRDIGPGLTQMGLLPAPPQVVVLEVPLLVEAPEFTEFADEVVAVIAPVEQRIARAVAAGMSEADALARIECQATDEERIRIADHVVVNAGTLEEFEVALERFWSSEVATR